jgi:hypothetical protein
MQTSRYGYTNIASEYLIYPFISPIEYNLNHTGTYSKYSIIDKFYVNSLIKPTKRLYYGGAEWVSTDPIALTFSLTNLAYSFADEILFMTASSPNLSITAPDSTYNRIDAIVVNEDGVVKIKSGTPAPSPKKPELSEDEVLIQYALVKTGVYKIGTSEIVYQNNSQWQTNTYQISGSISGSVNFASVNSQYNSTSCISSNTDYRTGLNFTKLTGTINRSEYTSLSMRVRFNVVPDRNRFLSAQIYGTSSSYTGTASSNSINLMAYGLDVNTIGTWQHIVVPTIKFGSKVETVKGLKIRLIGGASASNASWDLDYVLFQSGIDYDEYTDSSNATYTTSNVSTGGSGGGGTFSLTVEDYLTGDSFTDINKIIFRGNTVVVHPSGATAVGVSVTGQSPEITVWIPAPNYVTAFNPTIDTSGSLRYTALSTTQSYTQSVAPGTFGLGTWTPLSDFMANSASVGTTRKTKNGIVPFSPFNNSGVFSCENNTSTSMVFEVFKEDGTVVRTKTITPLNLATCGQTYATDDSGKTGMSITLGAFSNDQDKFKIASLSTSVDCQYIFPNGGRLKCRITYNNGSYTIVKNTEEFFYDNDVAPSSSIVGAVEFDELVATTKHFSGILFYKEGSTFAMTASNIDMLNDSTFPTTKQIDFEPFNLSMSNSSGNPLNGHADGTKSGVGSAITGWNINWDNKGLTFSKSGSINLIMNNGDSTSFNPGIDNVGYIPGFSPHTSNTLNSSKLSYIKARLFDYLSPDSMITSGTKKTLIDTDAASTPTYLSNPLDGEINRLDFATVFTSGSAVFDSTQLLTNAGNGELQYIFGRVIYPQNDFTTYMPKANWTRLCNYSTCVGVSKTFAVYTKGALDGSTPDATLAVPINGYRWHVTSYSKSANLSNSVNNGVFQFDSNFLESMLECPLGNIGTVGSGDLAILIGIDSSGTNTTPDRFLYISGDQGLYGGRNDSVTNSLDGNSRIGWTKNAVSVTVRKIWLFVGFKHNATVNTGGKSLRMSDILFIPA